MFKRFTDIVLYSSLIISLGSVALVIRTYYLFNIDIDWSVLLFVFFSTLFTYNISKIAPLWNFWKLKKEENYAYNNRNLWNVKHKSKLLYLSIFSLSALFVFLFDLSFYQILFLLHLGVISVLYSIPVFSGKAMRALPLIKIFLIAYVWAGMSILPFFVNIDNLDFEVFHLFLESFCFILAITIPFDIRDFTRDISQGVKTIPSILGIPKAKYLAVVLIIISTILAHYIFQNSTQELLNVGLNIFFIPIILNSKEKHSELYYLGLIDSTLILRLLVFYV